VQSLSTPGNEYPLTDIIFCALSSTGFTVTKVPVNKGAPPTVIFIGLNEKGLNVFLNPGASESKGAPKLTLSTLSIDRVIWI
jgi:hypothetical protein